MMKLSPVLNNKRVGAESRMAAFLRLEEHVSAAEQDLEAHHVAHECVNELMAERTSWTALTE